MSYQIIDCTTEKELKHVRLLLEKQGLRFEDKVTYTLGIYDRNQLIATGSLYENVLKMIAVDQKYQGENLTATVLTTLTQKLNEQGIQKYFLFTTPKNKHIFEAFSLSLIVENDEIVLFENNFLPIEEKLNLMKSLLPFNSGQTAAIVMNCNPVTNGHLYLIETCAKENDNVIIFLVEENKSIFPFDIRFKLLKKATRLMKNVHIIPSTQYIISRATFPTYFLKELNDASKLFMRLDIEIFIKYFMPIFSIDKRYVGNEPLDPTTNAYNETMQSLLNDKLVVIDRLERDNQVISASYVRKMVKENNFQALEHFVPKATFKFLKSHAGIALFHEK
ncbi:MAG: adenylyltransferase/cytidyltransferase family protein [Firmicutes bacterium]|nr:adenylyltransferase/cytidyltransferase family protein [Bacillota bacterium]